MVRNEDILKNILLKMNYDSSKTLTEQDNPRLDKVGSMVDNNRPSPSESNLKYYQVGCKYPNKAQQPPSLDGVSGEDAMIHGYCFYPASSNKNPGQVVGVWVPAASDIKWFDVADISEYVDQKINSKGLDSFWSGFTDDQIQSIITKNLVIGTIQSFNIGDRKVAGWFTKTGGSFNPDDVRYKGLFYTDNGKPYEQPGWEDRRTDWDKLVDEYGTAAQIFTALAFVALSIATGGVGGVALLATEIAIEGTLGAIIAQREWEKGNKVGAGAELLFGLTPWLKAVPGIRALKPGVVKSLTTKMGQAGLTETSSVDDIVTFYRSLNEVEQEAFTRLVKDTSDELSEASVKKALGRALTEETYDYVRKNPEVFKNLKWYQKVWAKEAGINGLLVIANTAYMAYFGNELTQQEKNELQGLFLKIPDDISKNIQYEIFSDPENTKKAIESLPQILSAYEKNASKISAKIDSAANIAIIYDSFNKNGVPLNNPKVQDTTSIPNGYKEISFEEYLKLNDMIDDGTIDEDNVKEMRGNNGQLIYLSKKSN